MNNKLRINFSEDKTKSIIFCKYCNPNAQKVRQLNIWYKHKNIKQLSQVTYLGYVLNEKMSGEPMVRKGYKQNRWNSYNFFVEKIDLTKELSKIL